MKTTHALIARGLANQALRKAASFSKESANRRWLEDSDLVKLCKLFNKKRRK